MVGAFHMIAFVFKPLNIAAINGYNCELPMVVRQSPGIFTIFVLPPAGCRPVNGFHTHFQFRHVQP